ncbi:MAG: DUF2911 domain-containing protein [Gemmatimonadota bacterium]
MMLRLRVAALLLAPLLAIPNPAAAQIRASEVGSISQMIDGTKITISYSRPRTRGRDPLFGTPAAHWGETWTPGANWATTFEVSKDVTINDTPVPRGKYSVWMILHEHGDWTTVLDSNSHRFHMEPPDSTVKAIRIPTHIDQAPFVDVLTWSVPELRVNGGTIAMQWGTTRASLRITVQPSLVVALAEEEARPYLGRYSFAWSDAPAGAKPILLTLSYENGILKGVFAPNDAWMGKFAMIRVGADYFAPGLYDKHGELYEVLRPDMIFTFARVGGRPESFEVRGEDDALIASGKRLP